MRLIIFNDPTVQNIGISEDRGVYISLKIFPVNKEEPIIKSKIYYQINTFLVILK